MTFNGAESSACISLIVRALLEDLSPEAALGMNGCQTLGPGRDRTSQTLIPEDKKGAALFVARSEGILAGLEAVMLVMERIGRWLSPDEHPSTSAEKIGQQPDFETPSFQPLLEDGNALHKGDQIARVEGCMRCILAAERIALNFLQRLNGIATMTSCFVEATKGLRCRICDTRKTLPGWRLLEKYAVRCGGGHNHRMGLYDGILIKDNHLAALGGGAEAIRKSIHAAREKIGTSLPVEVEVENLELLKVALDCRPDIVLLDNMSLDQLREAVQRRNETAPGIQLEASGGITLENVRAVAETGVDRISVGALTHSASALDIALDYETTV